MGEIGGSQLGGVGNLPRRILWCCVVVGGFGVESPKSRAREGVSKLLDRVYIIHVDT